MVLVVKNLLHKRRELNPWVGKTAGEGDGEPTPAFLHGRSPGGYGPWATEADTAELLSF